MHGTYGGNARRAGSAILHTGPTIPCHRPAFILKVHRWVLTDKRRNPLMQRLRALHPRCLRQILGCVCTPAGLGGGNLISPQGMDDDVRRKSGRGFCTQRAPLRKQRASTLPAAADESGIRSRRSSAHLMCAGGAGVVEKQARLLYMQRPASTRQ